MSVCEEAGRREQAESAIGSTMSAMRQSEEAEAAIKESELEEMQGAGRSTERAQLFKLLKTARRRADVEKCFAEIGNLTSEKEYVSAINAWGRAGIAERATMSLEEMHDRGFPPSEAAYGAAMTACAKAKQWKRACSLLEEMTARGLRPNVIHFNIAMSACDQARQPERALTLLADMQTLGVEPSLDQLQHGDIGLPVGRMRARPHFGGDGAARHRAGCDQLQLGHRGMLGRYDSAEPERALSLLETMRERGGAEPDQLRLGDCGVRQGRAVGARGLAARRDGRRGTPATRSATTRPSRRASKASNWIARSRS